MTKTEIKSALIINAVIVILEAVGAVLSCMKHGTRMFSFYTEDSNLLSLAACTLCVVYLARCLKTGARNIPSWVWLFKFAATCCLVLTFLVVVFVLAPLAGPQGYYRMLLCDSMLFNHLLCPVFAVISLLFFDRGNAPSKRTVYAALVPTALYAAVAVLLNLLQVMEGPYPFLRVYDQPWWMSVLWCIIILGGMSLICIAMGKLVTMRRLRQA